MKYDNTEAAWAARGRWLLDKLSERFVDDGRAVLELTGEDIWIRPDQGYGAYVDAVDLAMERDESRVAT